MGKDTKYNWEKTGVSYMTKKIMKQILCVGLACWMMAATPFMVYGANDVCDYEVAASRNIHCPDRDDD